MIDNLVEKLIDMYVRYEFQKMKKKSKKVILPNYVTKRKIQIYNNGKIVFDSDNVDEIPESIQYAIKSYGIPKDLNPNSKTPLIYRINTTLSSMFPSEEIEQKYMNSLNKTIG